MRQPSTLVLYAGFLVVGILIGAGFVAFPTNRSVHADNLDGANSERVYRELSTEGSSLQDGSMLLAKVATVTTPSVVHIQSERKVQGRKEEETGSGVILTSSKASGYFVVTNGHVIDKTPLDSISIHLYDGRVLQPERVWTDEASDIAVLKIDGPNLTAAKWGDSRKVDIGHMVLAMGSPFGLSRSVTFGIISARSRRQLKLGKSEVINQDFLQTDAAINPGNSGGPLVDLQGRVIGINTAIASSSGGNEGIGFSIPSHLAQRVMDQLLEFGVVPRAYIGVKLDDNFDSKVATKLKLDRLHGARVNDVYPNSPAARAGLQYDDVVLNFDGTDVQDHDHLINLVSLSPIGKQIRMTVWRAQKKIPLSIVLADRSVAMPRNTEPSSKPGTGSNIRPMGLIIHPLDGDLAEQLGYQRSAKGLLVLRVEGGSPLKSDVQVYDVIEAVGRTPVTTLDELNQALEASAHSESVILKIQRTAQREGHNQLVVWHK
ncbi:trypsin-like peptidase domain-containing protein [Schlesneria paludicola]|uniref:trypsin-like peptidase domain-containing protein n=1 Tax=Schlesneria paludicola TaxID=360056 RepID=UPI00029AD44D|nr:trypsin-like peptidase domain-containing protein [Schlesneria paludicola]